MKIVLASDHGGFQLKEAVKTALADKGHEVVDLGTDSEAPVDYPVFGKLAGDYVASGRAERGIVFCGTGIGIGIAANKVHGVRCAMVTGDEYAKLASGHNHANMIALGGRFVSAGDALRFIDIWLGTPWEGGRHDRRAEELDEM
ncbi:MAG: ribose 5-phosphate isomerase B [Clostridiales Family XIII bacterium]|jgi:ribose 5-phosphate isomerase B|nr:ribose 5-phosphate isomerase B [Clostridiales Family XIII bacterium]